MINYWWQYGFAGLIYDHWVAMANVVTFWIYSQYETFSHIVYNDKTTATTRLWCSIILLTVTYLRLIVKYVLKIYIKHTRCFIPSGIHLLNGKWPVLPFNCRRPGKRVHWCYFSTSSVWLGSNLQPLSVRLNSLPLGCQEIMREGDP